ncbi:MAG: hypothetical protein R2854_07920 [Caldilineaceae bacterium]
MIVSNASSTQLRQLCQDVPCVVALDQGRVAGFLGVPHRFRGVPGLW